MLAEKSSCAPGDGISNVSSCDCNREGGMKWPPARLRCSRRSTRTSHRACSTQNSTKGRAVSECSSSAHQDVSVSRYLAFKAEHARTKALSPVTSRSRYACAMCAAKRASHSRRSSSFSGIPCGIESRSARAILFVMFLRTPTLRTYHSTSLPRSLWDGRHRHPRIDTATPSRLPRHTCSCRPPILPSSPRSGTPRSETW